jgi:DNA primase
MMIPIFVDGEVRGFGGRYIPGEYDNPNFTPPKYLNSPESPIFKKR